MVSRSRALHFPQKEPPHQVEARVMPLCAADFAINDLPQPCTPNEINPLVQEPNRPGSLCKCQVSLLQPTFRVHPTWERMSIPSKSGCVNGLLFLEFVMLGHFPKM